MNMATKQEVIREKLEEYLSATREEKSRILNVLEETTSMHRKALVRRLNTLQMRPVGHKDHRGRPVIYTKAVTAAFHEVWEIANQICAERLHPVIGEYVMVLKRDRMWKHDEETTALLLGMSMGTMKNNIARIPHIRKKKGRGATKPSHLKEIIPIRRGPWQNPDPGFGEVDSVAHCGSTLVGDYAYTVQYTDVSTIWTCLGAQWNKGEIATQESMAGIRSRLPFPLRGIDPDSGSEFINWHLKGWCDERRIVMTRTRPYMKNDHARIEQKNYTNVREFVGFVRIDNPDAVSVMAELYLAVEDYINFFLPSVKCISKEKIGSRYKRVYDTSQTAYRRVVAHPLIANDVKERLQVKYATLNPKILKQQIDRLTHKLYAQKSIKESEGLR